MKRVLIIAHDFAPQGGSGTIRVTKFAKYLPEFGWQPVVVCSDNVWNPDPSLARDVPSVAEVHRVPWPQLATPFRPVPASPGANLDKAPAPQRSALRTAAVAGARQILVPDPLIVWVPAAIRACTKLVREGNIAAMLTTSPAHSTQLAGYWLKRRFPSVPWVADYRDPWSQSHLLLGRPRYWPNYYLERLCHERSDRVIVVTDSLRQLTRSVFPDLQDAKLLTITNGYDPADTAEVSTRDPDGSFTIAFVGSLLLESRRNTQFIPALFDMAEEVATRQQIRVRFVGFVPPGTRAQLGPLVDKGVVTIRDLVPRDQALAEMAAADALLLIESDLPEFRMSHSTKLFEYLAAGHPILAVAGEGEITTLIRRYGRGLTAHPEDREGIKIAIVRLMEDSKSAASERDVSQETLARFWRRNLTRELAHVLDECVGGHKALEAPSGAPAPAQEGEYL